MAVIDRNTLSTIYEKIYLLFRLGSRNRGRELKVVDRDRASITLVQPEDNNQMRELENKQLKENKVMETTINKINKLTLDIINTKEFAFWFKERIKALVADQKIAKRDRKDSRHPCPEKRVYETWKAHDVVQSNRWKLRVYYAFYYILRKKRDFRWDAFEITEETNYRGEKYYDWKYEYNRAEYLFDSCKIDHKLLSDHFNTRYVVKEFLALVYEYVNERKVEEKALCNC